jgi:hypothetical protein
VGTGRFRKLRAAISVRCAVPSPVQGEPDDDQLLRYLDNLMSSEERADFEVQLLDSPYTWACVEILAAALAECGWSRPD